MKPVILRNIPSEVDRRIRHRAEKERISLNKAVISLLEERVGEKSKKDDEVLYRDLDCLAGSWPIEEAKAFDTALDQQRFIDPEQWRSHAHPRHSDRDKGETPFLLDERS